MSSYVHSLFDALPLLLITGERQTGKTRLVEIMSELAFNGQLRSSLTAAALARQVPRDQPMLCIDEAEDLGTGRRQQEICRLLRAMYRRSGSREVCSAGGTTAISNIFCPVVIINILGVDDALRDRTIEIQSVPRGRDVERFRLYEQRHALQELRDGLYHFACAYVDDIYEIYRTFPSIPSLSDRAEELWLPIFTLARIVDAPAGNPSLLDEMVSLSRELRQQKAEQELFVARDKQIIAGLYFFLQEQGLLHDATPVINAAATTAFIRTTESLKDLRIEEVSRVLGRANIIEQRIRRRVRHSEAATHPLVHYVIDMRKAIESAKAVGVLPTA